MRFLVLCMIILLAAGCSTRENAKSLAMADQAVDASLRVMQSPDLVAAIKSIETVEISGVIVDKLNVIGQFLTQARDNIASPLRVLAKGEPVQRTISTEQAVLAPDQFIKAAAKQAARAEVEAESLLWWQSAISGFTRYITGDHGWLAQILMMLGVGGGTAGTLAMGARSLINSAKVKFAERAFQEEAATAHNDDHLKAIKQRHKKVQQDMGIHDHIDKRLKKKRAVA